ncbi:hypothetical protein KGB39_gp14 [Salmonella phage Skate]|uniref:Uncharacterized protein n=1 Tax=Salmonella phage Skate TaxID=2234035 RepID=A0A2Z5HTQ2_9CAUD|nr:hypothetical protein KGB39_gp14 [Salmonella phage Skate]AXC42972.1 hypothetical protein CPT_Skate_014 [Salmonella phage Skate]
MSTLEIIARSIITLWVISFAFGLCAFCTPWVWQRKNHFAIIYGPPCVMSMIVALFFVIVGVWS